jgi:ribonucleoside-diphosphate reductase alpha chain
LTEINVAACKTEKDFLDAVWAATYIGTLQASYTNFNYIHSDWKQYAEEEALLGVSFTGQAMNWPLLSAATLQAASYLALTTNALVAQRIGINMAHRIGTTKPAGSSSAWLGDRYGVTSGIHAAHDSQFIRRVRVDINNPMGQYLLDNFPLSEAESGEILELDKFSDHSIVVAIPVEMQGAILRQDETAVQLMERAKHIHTHWIRPTHRQGPNTHNVSLTVSYKQDEQKEVTEWMLKNRNSYAGMALLPFSDHCYTQAPFESVSDDTFKQYQSKFEAMNMDLAKINWTGHTDTRQGEQACGGGNCEIT